MKNSWTGKLLVAAAVLVILIGIALRFVGNGSQRSSSPPAALNEIAERRELATSVRPPSSRDSSDEDTQETSAANEGWPPPLPREKIEEYLKRHNRDAASLLAAFHATRDADNPSGDINYLKEAATNFPNNPQVQWTVLARDAFPEERRKWLDAFKVSSPDNSLTDYLSAQDYFKSGKPEAAVDELLAATGKSQFNNYTAEARLDEEELRSEAGRSPLESRLQSAGWASDLLPSLANFKGLAQSIQELQQRYADSGDMASAGNLAEMGITLASRLNSSDGSKLAINQLVGFAIQAIVLKQLDQNASYDFLGGKTPGETLAELKQQRQVMKDYSRTLSEVAPTMTEAEQLNFMDRERLVGEVEAMRWLHEQYGTNAP